MRYIKLALLLTLVLALTGCDDEFFDGGGASGGGGSGGDYKTYHGVQEVLPRRGYVGFAQKQEPPAPQSDQEDCPTVMVVLMLLGGLYGWQRNQNWTICPVLQVVGPIRFVGRG